MASDTCSPRDLPRVPRSLLFGAVDAILGSRPLFIFARILVTFMFWWAGFGFLFNFPGAVQMMSTYGLEPAAPIAASLVFVLLVGSAFVIDGRLAWFGAGMLSVFTLGTIPTIHPFWSMTGAAATEARLECEEHMSVIGGLILVSILCHLRRRSARSID
jgi:transmembrane protein